MGSTIALADAADLEPTFLPDGWEVKLLAAPEDQDAAPAAVGNPLISADEATGEVVAIVGITGIIDHVGDLIEPGAYSDTLVKRRPKVCWAHDWEKPVGKVPAIEEWAPGDPRFQQVKATLDGKPWPSSAGALVARMQFNMKSDRGREAFSAVEFYSETGECEWSIGWQTVPGQTVKRKDGVRVCKKVELYEVSPVLFGAAPLTRTLQLKTLSLEAATMAGLERKTVTTSSAGFTPGDGDEHERKLHELGMPDLDWDEIRTAGSDLAAGDACLTLPGGPTSTVTNSGTDAPKGFVIDASELSGLLDGLLDVEVKATDDPHGAAARSDGKGNKGNAGPLIHWYETGEGAAQIHWGTDGDFMRCVHIAEKHMSPEHAKGFCNIRHKHVTGGAPGHAPLELAEHAAKGSKSDGLAAAEALANTWNPMLEVGAFAAHTESKGLGMAVPMGDAAELTGTYEERQRALNDSLAEALRALNKPAVAGEDGDDDNDPRGLSDFYVNIDGTWDDHVVATYVDFGAQPTSRQTYVVPYSWDGDDVDLGMPQPVQLQVSVVPMDGDGDYDGDGPGDEDTDGDTGDEDDVSDALVAPVLTLLGTSTAGLKAALARSPEVKVGRVMSDANMSRFRAALEHLFAVAKAAGIDLSGVLPEPTTAAPQGVMPDTTAPGTAAAGVKALSVSQLQADLEEISNFLS